MLNLSGCPHTSIDCMNLIELKLGSDEQPMGLSGPLWAEVDLSGVRVERVRDFGEMYLALRYGGVWVWTNC